MKIILRNHIKSFISTSVVGVVVFGIYWFSLFTLPDLFFSHYQEANPKSGPWYFIYNDFRRFLSSLIGMAVSLLLLVPFYKKYRYAVQLGLYFTGMIYAMYVFKGIIILLNTTNITQPEIATQTWVSAEHYIDDPARRIILVFAIAWSLLFLFKFHRDKKRGLYREFG